MPTNYLPGVNVTLNDYGLRIFPEQGGVKVTLVGFVSNTGIPLYTPLSVSSVMDAVDKLSFYPATDDSTKIPGELSLAIEQVAGLATNVEVMAIGYTKDVVSDDSLTGLLEMFVPNSGISQARFSGLSGAYGVLRHHPTDIIVPVGAAIDDPWYNFGKQLADACYQATAAGNEVVGVIRTQSVLEWAYTHYGTLTGSYSDLVDELNDLFGSGRTASTQQAARSILFGIPSSVLSNLYVEAHGDPATANSFGFPAYYKAWLSGCVDGDGNYGSAASNSASVSSTYWSYWQATDSAGSSATDAYGNRVDAGGYISVLTTLTVSSSAQTQSLAAAVSGSLAYTNYNDIPVAAYAGLIAALPPQSATTNKSIATVAALKHISAAQASDLVMTRHVTMLNRATAFSVAKDVTGAHNVNRYVRSDYVLLTTVRIAHAAVSAVRAAAEKYIGEANNGPHREAMHTDIDAALKKLQESGALQSYNFVITSTPDQQVLGEVDIALTIVPAFEITNINLVVSLAKSA